MEDFRALKFKSILNHFCKEDFSFWMICGYLFIEYVRPQSIIPALDVLPWAQLFILLSFSGCLIDRSVTWVSDSTNKWMVIFLILIILSIVNATYPDISRKHFKDFYVWFFVYFLIINIVNSEKRFFIFLLIFLFASFKLSFSLAWRWASRGFSYTSWGLMGPPGFFQNSGELAIQMLMFSPIAYQLMVYLKPRLTKLKYRMMLAMPITGAMTVMGTSSRGGQIGMAFQLYHIFLKGRLSIKNILLVLTIIAVGYWAIPDEQKQRLDATGTDRTSVQRRLYWEHGIEMIQDHPWQGVGYFNFPRYYEDHYSQDLLYEQAQLPHNIFVQIGTDTGIPGLLVYLLLIYSGFKKTYEVRKLATKLPADSFNSSLARGFDAALVGFLIAGQFVTVGYYPFLWIHLAFVVSLKNITLKQAMPSINRQSLVRMSKSHSPSY
jgi:O-antigen ligase